MTHPFFISIDNGRTIKIGQTMELYQLNTFVVVAEEKHLTRASVRLNSSQPTVSAHIKALEEELETRLFIRTPEACS